MTTTEPAAPTTTAGKAVALQMGELVLKTGRFEEMRAWYGKMLGHDPFFERTPDPDAPPRPAGMPERAVDVRLAFFLVHESEHPHHQVVALFGLESLVGVQASGPGLHHAQFSADTLDDLFAQYDHLDAAGAHPHRIANHGQATSFYYRDPDGNVIEFTTSNFPTLDEELEFMASPVFAANPSGRELDPAEFASTDRSAAARQRLLGLEPRADRG